VLTREDVYMGDIVKHVMETQMHHASQAGVILEYLPQNRDLLLSVDRLKLQHILGHLMSNAIKHSNPGCSVSIAVDVANSGELLVTVSDTGTGIPKIKLVSIMEALAENNCWTAKNSQGIGLGLALTKEFIALHGGTVDIASKANEGTTVSIRLPANCIATDKEPAYLLQASR
jgi:signal transduction histidine kinase